MVFMEILGKTMGYFELGDMAPCRACGCAPVLKENSSQAMRLECPECGIRTRQSTSVGCYAEWNAVMGGPTREQLIAAHDAGSAGPDSCGPEDLLAEVG